MIYQVALEFASIKGILIEIVNEARPLSGKINCCMQQFIFLLSYCYLYLILHKFWSVSTCDILETGLKQ